jgi:hypothetical protein
MIKRLNIGVDFDGVLISLFLNRIWFDTSGKKVVKKHKLFLRLYAFFTYISQLLKRPIPGSLEILTKLKEEYPISFFLSTSRGSITKGPAISFLRRWGYIGIFSEYLFNLKNISSWECKYENMINKSLDIHIDDDVNVIEYLSQKLSRKKFILFSPNSDPDVDLPNVYIAKSWKDINMYIKRLLHNPD